MSKGYDPRRLDVQRFAEEGAELRATQGVRQFSRLLGESQPDGHDRAVTWSARGELRNPRHIHPQSWIHVQAESSLALVCQRCLGPVDVPVRVERSFRFASDEATAAAEDDDAEEEVLALSRNFDLQELIEDEILMEMPVAPRHEATCPDPLAMSVADAGFDEVPPERKNPFAVLGRLKTGKP